MTRLRPLFSVLLALAFVHPARAQGTWIAGPLDNGTAVNGADGPIAASIMWDPDGAGPLPPRLVVGGTSTLTSIDGVPVHQVAQLDPATGKWEAMGNDFTFVNALTVWNGDLIAGGSNLARWDGSQWLDLGAGMGVSSLAVNGSTLIAGGGLSPTGGIVRQFDGSSWTTLGPVFDGQVLTVTVFNGQVIAGGQFRSAGGDSLHGIAAWNGTSWSELGPGVKGDVWATTIYNGDLIAAGRFGIAGGTGSDDVARWDGASWHLVGSPSLGVRDVAKSIMNNGNLVAGFAHFLGVGEFTGYLTTWNGSAWVTSATADNEIDVVMPYGSDQFVSGRFTSIAGIPANRMARGAGSVWTSFGGGTTTSVLAMTSFMGHIVAGGAFHQSDDPYLPASNSAGWDGISLSSFGSGMNGEVAALCSFKGPGVNGSFELVAGGLFNVAGGVTANEVARWDVNPFQAFPPPAWQAMGSGFDNEVRALERYANNTYAGGQFVTSGGTPLNHIARWSGSSWEALGTGADGNVYALKNYNGYLYAGGDFTHMNGVLTGGLARWDGTSWSQVGGDFVGVVRALEVWNGVLVMAGSFPGFGGSPNLSSWNGTSYHNLGTGGTDNTVMALHAAGPKLYVGGLFGTAGGGSASHLAVWDGSLWQGVGGGTDNAVEALADIGGELEIGGVFLNAAGGALASPTWARWSETGLPWFGVQPFAQSVSSGSNVTMTAVPASGYNVTGLRWYHNGQALTDGSAAKMLETQSTRSGSTTTTLTLTNVTKSDAGYYELHATNSAGTVSSTSVDLAVDGVTAVGAAVPSGSMFESLGPNPATGAAAAALTLARAADVTLRVFDLGGRVIRDLDAGRFAAGPHEVRWDGRDTGGRRAAPGLYFVHIDANGLSLGTRLLTILE